MKIVNDINAYVESMCKDVENKKWAKAIVKFVALVVVGLCMILCLIWLVTLVYEYIIVFLDKTILYP